MLTLQGREFLHIAGKEKAYIFIVVNRFDQIKRRADRCKKEILGTCPGALLIVSDQIREISPRTFDDADNLVHFVSARQCLEETPDHPGTVEDFIRLEDCLRAFVLEKRSKSKLAPAKQYLCNLLADVIILADSSAAACEKEHERVSRQIDKVTPSYRTMLDLQFHLEDADSRIESTCDEIQTTVHNHLADFLDNIDYVADDIPWVTYSEFLC